jgi:hypothetical protein
MMRADFPPFCEFDMTIAEFESLSLTIGIAGLVLFMVFIIYDLAKNSNAGKVGTAILFITLGLGLFGFVIKTVIVEAMIK